MFSVSGELISETRSIIIAHDFGTFRTFRPFRDILDKLPVLGHFGHFARFGTFGTKRKAAALLPESAALASLTCGTFNDFHSIYRNIADTHSTFIHATKPKLRIIKIKSGVHGF